MAVAVYLRVSSKSQTVRAQRREIERYLEANGIVDAQWFVDEGVSGAVVSRLGLDELKARVFNGEIDTLILYSLDRLARNAVEGINLISTWMGRGIRLIVLTMQMDFSGEVGQMVASLLLHIAQMERTSIRERQASGIAAAKAAGKRWGGRKNGVGRKVDPGRVMELRRRGLTNREIGQALNISERTVIRYVGRTGTSDQFPRA